MLFGKPAVFKGSNEGVILYINPDFQFEAVVTYLAKFLEQNKQFFSGSSIIVDAPKREFTEEELSSLEGLFSQYAISFTVKGLDRVFGREEVAKQQNVLTEQIIVIPHTMRSGQVVNFDGNVVILGNINEGAQVEATQDVYVFGIIKGIVNAGRRIVSLGFKPLRMQLGSKTIELESNDKSYKKPRVIEIVNGEVQIKPVGEPEKKRRVKG